MVRAPGRGRLVTTPQPPGDDATPQTPDRDQNLTGTPPRPATSDPAVAVPAVEVPAGGGLNGRPPIETRVQAVARVVDRALRRVEDLDRRVSALAEVITDLAHKLTADRSGVAEQESPADDQSGTGPVGPGLRSWLLADDPAQADADLSDLVGWVWRVYLWWPDAWLSSCWLWHPEVIEELWWLRVAHADAYDRKSGTSWRVGDWHDRLRPGVVRRLRPIVVKCELNRHVPFNGRPVEVTPPGPPGLARHAGAVAAVWAAGAGLDGVVRAAGPQPGPEQLAEAEAYQNAAYRSRR